MLKLTCRQTDRYVLKVLVWSDEGKRVFSCRFDRGHVQGDREGGDTQLIALSVGVNPEVVTPDGSVGTAPWVLDGDLSVQFSRGGAWLASGSQQRCDPTILNL